VEGGSTHGDDSCGRCNGGDREEGPWPLPLPDERGQDDLVLVERGEWGCWWGCGWRRVDPQGNLIVEGRLDPLRDRLGHGTGCGRGGEQGPDLGLDSRVELAVPVVGVL
jgi:hypothetical protein